MRRLRAMIPGLVVALAAAPAAAQTIVTSPNPDHVEVTIYRAPHRDAGTPINLEWLDGYALISETRRVTIPAGESDIRFEGVAGGIIPQSAIVTGFPEGIVERNRDAYLLSPDTLLDRSLGRRVHLRRTSRATGAVAEQDAIIRSGAGGAVVLQTQAGFEALRCTGQAETLVYDQVPPGLSARPTLSVRARSSRAVSATVTLSYLANGFDWQANYIANLSPDGSRVELFAWLTLASTDETSFRNADAQAVAGRLNRAQADREEEDDDDEYYRPLTLNCWPQGTIGFPTRVLNSAEVRLQGTIHTEDFINNLPQVMDDESNIIVTASRARQENLGDVKLYRIPEPVTVAANSQKQVAFLDQPEVRAQLVYRDRIETSSDGAEYTPTRMLVTRNRTEEGLGIPLPAGTVQLFVAADDGRPLLLGEAMIRDLAVGEDVEIEIGEAVGVTAEVVETESRRHHEDHRLTVTNDHAVPIRYEAEFVVDENERFRPREPLPSRHGRPLWAVTVPANGTVTIEYRLTQTD
ncbi:MAG: hypothetical protein QOJ53_1491 [Sphingomonadales bacterium]|jgi:hypothetical protein|nr:hypothetical protein [Sphingomonadales bacterium]